MRAMSKVFACCCWTLSTALLIGGPTPAAADSAAKETSETVAEASESSAAVLLSATALAVAESSPAAQSDPAEATTTADAQCDSEPCEKDCDAEGACEATSCDAADGGQKTSVAAKADAASDDVFRATHRQTQLIKVNADGLPERALKTFCLTADGIVVAACADNDDNGDVRLFGADGELIDSWDLPIAAEAINLGSDGRLYIAGGGKLARYTLEGELINEATAPHVEALTGNREAVRKQVIANHNRQREWMSEFVEDLQTQIEEIDKRIAASEKAAAEKKDGQDESAEPDAKEEGGPANLFRSLQQRLAKGPASLDRDKAMRESLKQQLTAYERMIESQGDAELTEEQIEQQVESSIAYKCRVASISECDGEVFLATGMQKGYGFAVWRTSRHFDDGREIVKGLSGCCGQMDVQCCPEGLYVAENSRARVACFDRNGKSVRSWGERGRDGIEGFASCCNPMNVAFGADGSVYTAESKVGRIKKYSPEGELLELVGKVDLIPGCDKVTIAVGPSGDRIYMLDITRNHIVVLERAAEGETVAYTERKSAPASSPVAQLFKAVFGN